MLPIHGSPLLNYSKSWSRPCNDSVNRDGIRVTEQIAGKAQNLNWTMRKYPLSSQTIFFDWSEAVCVRQ